MWERIGWAKNNLWNIFSVLGVLATFYFSLLYVPDYVRQIAVGKVNVIHEELVGDVQEMLFNDQEISLTDVESFVRGKELSGAVTYSYTPDELLLQVQDRFLNNKFIPLERRRELVDKITKIRGEYKAENHIANEDSKLISYISFGASLFGVLMGILGALSLWFKNVLDKEIQIEILEAEKVIDDQAKSVVSGKEYENMVVEVLRKIGSIDSDYIGFVDYMLMVNGKSYGVDVKKYRNLLGVSSIMLYMEFAKEAGCDSILVVSSGVTKMAQKRINEYNELGGHQVYVVAGEDEEVITAGIKSVVGIA